MRTPRPPDRATGRGRGRGRGLAPALILALVPISTLLPPTLPPAAPAPALAAPDSPRIGAPGMLEPFTASLLVDYFEAFLRDQDLEAFRRNVEARYTEGTLARLVSSGDVRARRAAVLALGLVGSFASNDAVGRALRDPDPTVRDLADNALWAIWFRADTPEHNATLEQVRQLIGRERLAEAEALANRLVADAPAFAEAYNQRAIARFFLGRFAESAADCRRTIELNPYHTGALSGLGRCYLRMGRRREALETFRKALKIQPHNAGLRQVIADLGGEEEAER